jgi:proline iminopeptidase
VGQPRRRGSGRTGDRGDCWFIVASAIGRGPVTARQTLWVMAIGLALGTVTGFLLRLRWGMLLAPVAYAAAFELGRRDTDGPLVDGIHLGTTFGILAFVLGRGIFALVGLVPILLGVAYGAALARRCAGTGMLSSKRGVGLYVRRISVGLTTVGLVAIAILIALPASVPPVRGTDGESVATDPTPSRSRPIKPRPS